MHDRGDSNRDETAEMNRRGFLEAGAGGLAAAAILGQVTGAQAQEKAKATGSAVLPKRTLGRTGVEVSILNLGTWKSVGLDRILRFAWANGIRYIDTAGATAPSRRSAAGSRRCPRSARRSFLVTKDHPTHAQGS